jgi:hypothetical protein
MLAALLSARIKIGELEFALLGWKSSRNCLVSTNMFPFLAAPGADDDGMRFYFHIVKLNSDVSQS